MKIIKAFACCCFLITIFINANGQSNGVCDLGEPASHPDCNGICEPGDDPNSVDCNGICDAGDDPTGPDCNGTCDANETSSSPDCNGICDPGDDPSGPDCANICNPTEIYLSSNELCDQSKTGTTVGADIWVGDFCGQVSAQAAFYRFTSDQSTSYNIELSNTPADHTIAVFEDCSTDDPISCNSTSLSVALDMGEDYIIAVFPTTSGNTSVFDLCIYIPIDYTTGNVGVNTSTPVTRLEVDGGVKPGYTSNEVSGNIRWYNDLEVFDGSLWKSLTQWDHIATTDIDMQNNQITNLDVPISDLDAATKEYVDNHTDGDSDASNEIQTLSKLGNTIFLSSGGGSFVDADASSTNEIQTLSKSGNTVTLSLGGGGFSDAVNDADADPNNEIQVLSKSGNIVSLSQGGGSFSDEVNDADNDPTNEIETWNTLAGIPSDIADGDDVVDADADPINEIQLLSKSGSTVSLSQGGGSFIDAVDDADNDPANEIETWNTLAGIPPDIADGDNVDDADADPDNELITSAGLSGTNLKIFEAGVEIDVDLSGIATQWNNNGSEIYYPTANVGIGASDPTEKLDVRGTTQVQMNSSGNSPQLQLVETSGTDGARINFQSSVETDNLWTLFGRADNTLEDNSFNIFHTINGNIVRIRGNGDIGLNGAPDTDLHVFHGNTESEDGMKLQNSSGSNNWWRMFVSSSGADLQLYSKNQGATILGTFDETTGVYSNASDVRLKQDIEELHFSKEDFMELRPYTYRFRNSNKNKKTIGLLAQDVEKVFPELVTYVASSDQYLLDYSSLSVIAIKTIQDQQNEIDSLQEKNRLLRKDVDELKQLVKKLVEK